MSPADGLPELLPAPRHVEPLDAAPPDPEASPACHHDPDLPEQGFELRLDARGIVLRHRDEAGLRYGRALLDQWRQQATGSPRALLVRDWPDFAVRGTMLDVSRDRVPTRASLERLVDQLALLRINHLELYTEHTFAYAEHEEVWRNASPLTAAEVRWLDARCAERGIELAANQNCFGHMERWLRHERYRPLAEAPDGFQSSAGWRPAATLAPTPESLAFVRGLLDELLPLFTSRRVNVGCDETFDLGRGRSRDAVRARGLGRVYLDFLLGILDCAHRHGREALFWGDILRHHPELVAELPKHDTVALAWHYEAPLDAATLPEPVRERLAGVGLSSDWLRGFGGHVAPFASSGLPFWVCPGTSTWNTLLGRWPNARANLLDAAAVGLRTGAGGVLITDWGDNGHLQPPAASLLPLGWGAALAWCAASNADADLPRLLDRFVFRDAAGVLGAALQRMGSLDGLTGLRTFNASPLHGALLGEARSRAWGEPDAAGLATLHGELDDLDATLATARPACAGGEQMTRELRQGLRLARHGAWRLAREVGLEAPSPAELRHHLEAALEEQRACWLAASRPGGLPDSLARLERTLAEYA